MDGANSARKLAQKLKLVLEGSHVLRLGFELDVLGEGREQMRFDVVAVAGYRLGQGGQLVAVILDGNETFVNKLVVALE